mgnify:CR=1 FL=1
MRSAAIAVTLCGFLLNIGLAQVKPTTLQPTRLEAFAGRPTAKVTWFSEVGRIVSEEASVTVTALMIKDAGQFGSIWPIRMPETRSTLNRLSLMR